VFVERKAVYFRRLIGVGCAALCATAALAVLPAWASAATLTGSGSTLVAPIEAEWAAAWGQATGNTVQYQSVGSGAGIRDISNRLVDFGASDAPLTAAQAAQCNGCYQIPWALGAVGIGYHLNGVKGLHLNGTVVALIYLGKITKWNDPQIQRLNKGKSLPDLAITPLHRSDGSGTTYAFADYMSRVSTSWKSQIGTSTSVNWPVGPGGNGNAGVVALLDSTNGAISYNEVAYLIAHHEPAAAIRNRAGKWLFPNLSAIAAAGRTVKSVPANNEMHIVNPPKKAKNAYPIATFTYAIVPGNAKQAALLKQFVTYVVGTGQRFGPALDFAPIPSAVKKAALATLSKIPG
jgi:phosphate transport system substrate-binding protein